MTEAGGGGGGGVGGGGGGGGSRVLSRFDSIAVGSGEFTGQVKGSFSFFLKPFLDGVSGLLRAIFLQGCLLGVAFPHGGLFQSAAMFR